MLSHFFTQNLTFFCGTQRCFKMLTVFVSSVKFNAPRHIVELSDNFINSILDPIDFQCMDLDL